MRRPEARIWKNRTFRDPFRIERGGFFHAHGKADVPAHGMLIRENSGMRRESGILGERKYGICRKAPPEPHVRRRKKSGSVPVILKGN